ncbi:alpha/beta fold hydrolase, partial [Streptomyces sp. NRRL S-15]
MKSVRLGELAFDVSVSGPKGGPTVLLLHGFPQTHRCWDRVAALLNAAGVQTVAPDQRGYSPGARPVGRAAYRIDHLVADALGILDQVGVPQAHIAGHDWGALVAW